MSSKLNNKKIISYKNSCDKATSWLLNFINSDGSIGPVNERLYYYRVPWCLALMGEHTVAQNKLNWITDYMFTSDGEFEGISPRGIFDTRYGSYPLSCLLIGANLLQNYEIVYPGTTKLLNWQNNVTGGFFNKLDVTSQDAEEELFPTCQAGITLLNLGKINYAIQVGNWLNNLWDIQPDIEHQLYHVSNSKIGLITNFSQDDQPLYSTKKDEPWQHHFNGGIAAAFLVHLYSATGNKSWIKLARSFQKFSMTTDICQFQSMQACKSSWGSSLLFMSTKEKKYFDWCIRFGDWYLENQHNDGHWENTKHWNPKPTLGDNIEITAEFIIHLSNIMKYISA